MAEEAIPVSRRRNWWLIFALTVVAALLLFVLAGWVAAMRFAPAGRVAGNVSIEGVAVGGLTRDGAFDTITADWLRALPDRVVLTAGDDSWGFGPEELGQVVLLDQAVDRAMAVGHEDRAIPRLRSVWQAWRSGVSVNVQCTVAEQRLRQSLVELAPQVHREPRNAKVEVVNDRDVQVTPGVVGRSLKLDGSMVKVGLALVSPHVKTIKLDVETQEPAIKAEDLAHLEVVLSSYTTKFNAGIKGRTSNLTKAAKAMNKTAITPGGTFSFNDTVGPRLVETGYRTAKIYVNGQVVDDIGGGVCQVASTMYNAALLANLEIVERYRHSLAVTYVPASRDATVSYGQRDFRFRNSLSNTVLLLTSVSRNTLTVKILGAKVDRYDVELKVSGVGTIPYEVKEIQDPDLEEGEREVETKGKNGRTGTLTQIVRKDGREIERKVLHSDRYSPVKEVVRVGAKAPEEPEEIPEGELEPLPSDIAEPEEPEEPV